MSSDHQAYVGPWVFTCSVQLGMLATLGCSCAMGQGMFCLGVSESCIM